MEGISQELQNELKHFQKEGSKRTMTLWGMIRKIRSINSVLLMKRDEARKGLEAYVNKLSQCLMDFRTEMEASIDKRLSDKLAELDLMKKRYKDDIDTLVMLCTEIESMVQFGKNMTGHAEHAKAQSILETFRLFLSRETTENSTKNLPRFNVKTTLQLEEITPKIFGQMFSDAPFSNTEEHHQTGLQTGTLRVKIEKDVKSSQTLIDCAEKGIQTDNLCVGANYQPQALLSPGLPVYNAIPDPQNLNPLQILNSPSPLPVLSPILVYDPCLMVGDAPVGVDYNNKMPLLQEQNILNLHTSRHKVDTSSDLNVNSRAPGPTLHAGDRERSCPPGFTMADASPTCINSTMNNSSNTDYSCEFSDIMSANDEVGDGDSSCQLSSEKSTRVCDVNLKGQGLKDYRTAQYDRSSVYVPPPVPDFVKDLKKQFDGSKPRIERKPLRKPFSQPAEMGVENTADGYCHSTPIKDRHQVESEVQAPVEVHTRKQGNDTSRKVVRDFDKSDENDNLLFCKQEAGCPAELQNTANFSEISNLNLNCNKTLSDHLKENCPKSTREVSKQTLTAQTSWCKGYLTNFLRASNKENTSELDYDNQQNAGNHDVKVTIKSEVVENSLGHAECHSGPGVTKSLSSKIDKCQNDQEVEDMSGEDTHVKHKDDSGVYVNDKSKTEQSCTVNKERDLEDSVHTEEDKSRKNLPCTAFNDQSLNTDKNAVPSSSNGVGSIEKSDASRGNDDIKVKETDQRPSSSQDATPSSAEEKQLDRHVQTQNLNQAVKQFLGDGKKNSSQKTRKLGALQAHWLKKCRGSGFYSDMDAKFLFQLTGNFHFPIGITTNSKNHMIVADTGNHLVKIFDESGRHICELGADLPIPLKRPSAIVVNESDEIFIKDDICIRAFSKTGQFIKDVGKNAFKRAFGLAMTPAKNLLVLDTHRSNPSLVHISQDGKEVFHFLFTPLINAHPQSKCRFLGVSDNNVIVSDLGISQVYITTLEGVYLTQIGMYGSGLRQFCEPSGVSVDIYGNFVIGDSKNNRIQIYRYDGSFTGLLYVDEPIVRPSGLHLTSDNKLLVVNFLDHCVKVYQL